MNSTFVRFAIFMTLMFVGAGSVPVFAQEDPPAEAKPDGAAETDSRNIVIPDEPKYVDPATLVPEPLAQPVTVEFDDATLKEVVQWINDEMKIPTILDEAALTNDGILTNEPVTDHLDNEPLYLLLNRLVALQLGWYMQNGILYVTTEIEADSMMETVPHNLADFIDKGYKAQDLTRTIMFTTGGLWEEDGDGEGHLILLGDVVFIKQTQAIHREVAGLLSALRNHGRQTYILEPAQHEALRQKLQTPVSVEFKDVALRVAVEEAGQQAGVDIRLEMLELENEGISEREPITFGLADQPLSIVLTAMLAKYRLTYILEDGIFLVTTGLRADETLKTAVYDVRDLSRDEGEAHALARAVMSQTNGLWETNGDGEGTISFASPRAMVVRQNERAHASVLTLLENYRAALKIAKPRDRTETDRAEELILYYRLPTLMVDDMQALITKTVAPESWHSEEERPEGFGTIETVVSVPQTTSGAPVVVQVNGEEEALRPSRSSDYSTMIIKQSRENHEEIFMLLQKVQYGYLHDIPYRGVKGAYGMGMGGMGGGMGMFGGDGEAGGAMGGMGGMGGGMGGMGGGGGFGSGYFRVIDN